MKSRRFLPLLVLAGIGFIATAGWSNSSLPPGSDHGHSSPKMVRVTLLNGVSRVLRFEGVGCSVSMCSRVRIENTMKGSLKGDQTLKSEETWLDSVASIDEITPAGALFSFKDGSARRLPIVAGNRFLYTRGGKTELGMLRSVEFLAR